ncbi:IS66 family insertion sequence element accessory protein TnpA [Tissierella sp.]|uniref:IS66 family insertion sequence element accessory protein TnpA n=1 Tax=Tissierella sp. TaxID=41274 RepID=UPI003F9D5A82
MKESKHEILKSKWIEIIKRHSSSGISIKQWCGENDISKGQFYYWQRVIREEALIKAGTLAVSGQTEFVEVKPGTPKSNFKNQDVCAILRSNGNEIEVLNGADPNTLKTLLSLMGN